MPQIPKGAIVKHKTKGFVGTVLGTTSLVHLFEDPQSEIEYRVFAGGGVHVAPAAELMIIAQRAGSIPAGAGGAFAGPGSGYFNYCWSCHSDINHTMERCGLCGWFICAVCGACGRDCSRGRRP